MKNFIPVELVLRHENFKNGTWPSPEYATAGSAAFDLLAAIEKTVIINSLETHFIDTGISVWIQDPRYAMLLLPRSGKGCNGGIVLGNSVGLLDSDYLGPVKLCVFNRTKYPVIINPGDHIAQALITEVAHAKFTVVDQFSDTTDRGTNGFGSTKK